jgi:hypothetical protein
VKPQAAAERAFFYVYYVESEQLQIYSVQDRTAFIVGKLQIKRKIVE